MLFQQHICPIFFILSLQISIVQTTYHNFILHVSILQTVWVRCGDIITALKMMIITAMGQRSSRDNEMY